MNATKWATLSDFVQYLGKSALCVVDFDDATQQWYLKYIDRSPAALQRKQKLQEMAENERKREEYAEKLIERQRLEALRAKERQIDNDDQRQPDPNSHAIANSIVNAKTCVNSNETRLTLRIPKASSAQSKPQLAFERLIENISTRPNKIINLTQNDKKRKISAMEEIVLEEEDKRRKQEEALKKVEEVRRLAEQIMQRQEAMKGAENVKDEPTKIEAFVAEPNVKIESDSIFSDNSKRTWLTPGIIVKCINKHHGSVYKRKGRIVAIDPHDSSLATIEFPDQQINVQLHESDCETVLPAIGKTVLIVNPSYPQHGHKARLVALDEQNYCCSIELLDSHQVLKYVQYEDMCKVAE